MSELWCGLCTLWAGGAYSKGPILAVDAIKGYCGVVREF